MTGDRENEVKVGFFVSIGLGLLLLSLLIIGGESSIFSRYNRYSTHFPAVDGLVSGSKVMLAGIQIGTVEGVSLDTGRQDVKVELKILTRYKNAIREDVFAEIATQGVLGDKYLTLLPGKPDAPVLKTGGELPGKASQNLTEFISKSDQLLFQLNSIAKNLDTMLKGFNSGNRSEMFFEGLARSAKNLSEVSQNLSKEFDQMQLKSSIRHLNSILEKIDRGSGTIGALVNDPALYDEAKSLVGGANRNRVVRNLVRKTIKEHEGQ